jgi:hypothetical protein
LPQKHLRVEAVVGPPARPYADPAANDGEGIMMNEGAKRARDRRVCRLDKVMLDL